MNRSDLQLPPGCVCACPGCAHRNWSAADSEAQKASWIARQLSPWAESIQPLRAVAEPQRWNYRNKVALAAEWSADDKQWQFGLRRRDELIPIPDCPIHAESVRGMVALLSEALPPADQIPLAFYAQSGAQATLIVKSAQLSNFEWLTDTLIGQIKALGIEALWLHRYPAVGRKLFAKNQWDLLWGATRSQDGQGLRYGPTAFQQLIPPLYAQALDEAQAFFAADSDSALLDLYCGSGSTLRRWLADGANVLGVELGGEAVECARVNAPGAELLRGACETRIPQLQVWAEAQREAGRRPLLYLNPPRTGLEPGLRDWVCDSYRPERIAYLSCSAGTLSRDLHALTARGYRVVSARAYDFFPHTYHVETLVLLQC